MSQSDTTRRLVTMMEKLLLRPAGTEPSWEANSDGNGFEVSTQRGSVEILSVDNDDAFPFEFIVYNSYGIAVESLKSFAPPATEYEQHVNQLMRDLYFHARADSYDVDSVLEDLFDELGLD